MMVLVGYGINVFWNGQSVDGKIAELVGHGPCKRHEIKSHRIAAKHMQTDGLMLSRLVTRYVICASTLKTVHI